jgi:tRNA nucleotidyltransferase (CCA-adding enzyme)
MARSVRTPEQAEADLRALPGGAAVLEAVAAHAGAWVVGGAVRDALLGLVPGELDVVLPASPDALERFAAGLGVDLEERHERFGTGTLQAPDGLRVDLVTARRERYASPGALPEVEPADLDADLRRRDVTVNAMALRPGEPLRAVPAARDDLIAGLLRVLHDASFTDDPTRLWRVARYGARLGFAPEPATAALAAAADPATASGPRHGNELRRTLAEREPVTALLATQSLAPRLLPAGFAPRDASDALALLPAGEGRPGLVVLARACAGVDAATLVAWLDALGFTAAERDVVAAGSRAATLAPLRAARGGAAIARAARGAPLEVVALAGGDAARRWIDELRHVELAIDGEDLVAAGIAPGPDLGARLQRARDARMEGDALTREQQLTVALS